MFLKRMTFHSILSLYIVSDPKIQNIDFVYHIMLDLNRSIYRINERNFLFFSLKSQKYDKKKWHKINCLLNVITFVKFLLRNHIHIPCIYIYVLLI